MATASPPIFLWERLIDTDQERAWEALEALVHRAPQDVEVMAMAAWRVQMFLERDLAGFCDRAEALLARSSTFNAFVEPDALVPAAYGPRYEQPEQLAEFWLENHRAADALAAAEAEAEASGESDARVAFGLELIRRGPLHGLDSDDVSGELVRTLAEFGPTAIEAIERGAQGSAAVRLAIWSARHLYESQIDTRLWTRFIRAAGMTHAANTPLPAGEARILAPAEEHRVTAWLTRQRHAWAWGEVQELAERRPELGFRAIMEIARLAGSPEELAACGAGPLEDFVRAHSEQFMDRIEAESGPGSALREALAAVWIKRSDAPESILRRLRTASGARLQILTDP